MVLGVALYLLLCSSGVGCGVILTAVFSSGVGCGVGCGVILTAVF